MVKRKPKHISQADWDAVNSPPLVAEELARMRPASETHPHIVERYRRARGPQKEPRKVVTTIRLDAEVVAHFKARGRGWQTRINEALRRVISR